MSSEQLLKKLNQLSLNELTQLGSEFGVEISKKSTKKIIINKFIENCDNLDSKLKYINDKLEVRNNNELVEYLRFNCGVWALPDSSMDKDDKYFNQKYIKLTDKQIKLFEQLLGISMKTMLNSLAPNLKTHTELLSNNSELMDLVAKHAGKALHIKNKDGVKLNNELLNSKIIHPIITFRTLITEYRPKLVKGRIYKTEDIWSTSYDPLSSIGFGISMDCEYLYIIRASLPKDIKGALFIENNSEGVVKEQHEITLAAGIPFIVENIKENVDITVFDDKENETIVNATIYDISFFI